jgi:hypothetical protein
MERAGMIAPSLQMPGGSIASIAALGERKQPTFQALFLAPRKGFVDQYFRLRGRRLGSAEPAERL